MKRAVLTLVLLAAACSPAPDLTPVPGQGLFTVIVWNDVFGQTTKAPPIEWRHDLTCTTETGFPGFETDGECISGKWVRGDHFVSVAAIPGMRPSETGMVAHEFLHAKLAWAGHNDTDHQSPEWQPGGLFDLANAKLADAGW